MFATKIETPTGLKSEVIDPNSGGIVLSWTPIKSRVLNYVVSIAPTAKFCGRFHNEEIR